LPFKRDLQRYIVAKDQLGNVKFDPAEDESGLFALTITRCGGALQVESS
jgi:hypothetical protein